MTEELLREHDYACYPWRFLSYRWFKPVIVGVLGFIFYMVLTIGFNVGIYAFGSEEAIAAMSGSVSYDTMDAYTAVGAFYMMGGIAIMIPALALAGLIVRDRPFSSYSSSMGGLRFDVLVRSILLALIAAAPSIVMGFAAGKVAENKFTLAGFVVLTLMCPLQCLAEEYIFRGFLMQTIGSWTGLWILGAVGQVVLFAMMHPYNIYGVISILLVGFTLGFLAWYTHGLEAPTALHIANNLTAFYSSGFGYSQVQTDVPPSDVVSTAILCGLYVALVVLIQRKTGLYDKVKRDDVTPWNERVEARRK